MAFIEVFILLEFFFIACKIRGYWLKDGSTGTIEYSIMPIGIEPSFVIHELRS